MVDSKEFPTKQLILRNRDSLISDTHIRFGGYSGYHSDSSRTRVGLMTFHSSTGLFRKRGRKFFLARSLKLTAKRNCSI